MAALDIDFSTFSEVDPNNHIDAANASHLDAVLYQNEKAYRYKDYGADYFGDVEIQLKFDWTDSSHTSATIQGAVLVLANALGSIDELVAASEDFIMLSIRSADVGVWAEFALTKVESGSNAASDTSNDFADDTTYYIKLVRRGPNLTFILASDENFDSVLDVLQITEPTEGSFRYLYCASSNDTSNAITLDYNLNTFTATPPSTPSWALARGRIEIHHGPPAFFDDHFKSGWSPSTFCAVSQSADTVRLYAPIVTGANATFTYTPGVSFNTDTFTRINVRVESTSNIGEVFVDLYYDAAWNQEGELDAGLNVITPTASKDVTGIRFRLLPDGAFHASATIDYISVTKGAITVPLNAPTTQDIEGAVTVKPALNALASATFVVNNVPSSFGGDAPYKAASIADKDVVLIWFYRDGDTLDHTYKMFGGVIVKYDYIGENVASHLLSIECLDHGWELSKPIALFSTAYRTATNGKTIMKAAVDAGCSYLDSYLLDFYSEVGSTHQVDYSKPGDEVTPLTVLEELCPNAVTHAGAIGFDWKITPSGLVNAFPRASESSGASLGDADLEAFSRGSDWWEMWNDITIYGAAEKTEPDPTHSYCTGSTSSETDDTIYSQTSATYVEATSVVLSASNMVYLYQIQTDFAIDAGTTGSWKVTYQEDGGSETDIDEWTTGPGTYPSFNTRTSTTSLATLPVKFDYGNDVTIRWYFKRTGGAGNVYLDLMTALFYNWIHDVNGTGSDDVLSVEGTIVYQASSSIQLDTNNVQDSSLSIYPTTNIDAIEFGFIAGAVYLPSTANVLKDFGVKLKDSNGYYAIQYLSASQDNWTSFSLQVGYKSESVWSISNTLFDWNDIDEIEIMSFASAGTTWTWYVAEVHWGGKRFSGNAANATSKTTWGTLIRPVEVDDSLISDTECAQRADGLLELYEAPVIVITGVRLDTGFKISIGKTVGFSSGTPDLEDTVRIVSATHILIGTEWETTYDLSNKPVEVDKVFLSQKLGIKLAQRGK